MTQSRFTRLARHIIESGCTVREAAAWYGISKSTVHKDVTQRLREENSGLYAEVKEILEKNNFIVKLTDIIGVELDDSPGGLTKVLKILKDENIDLEYLYAFTHDQTSKAILLLHSNDLDEMVNVLDSNNAKIVPADVVYNL